MRWPAAAFVDALVANRDRFAFNAVVMKYTVRAVVAAATPVRRVSSLF